MPSPEEKKPEVFSDLHEDDQKVYEERLQKHSGDRFAEGADWLKNGVRLFLILNAGGVLALLTAGGALIKENKSLDPLLLPAIIFLIGLIVAAFAVVLIVSINLVYTNNVIDINRDIIDDKISIEAGISEDRRLSSIHNYAQIATLGLVGCSFLLFVSGSYLGLLSIRDVANPPPPPTKETGSISSPSLVEDPSARL